MRRLHASAWVFIAFLLLVSARAAPYSEGETAAGRTSRPGDAYIHVWDGKGAEAFARKGLRTQPNSLPLHFLLGRGLFYQGKYGESLDVLSRAVRLISPEDSASEEVVAYRDFVARTIAATRSLDRFERDGVVVFLDSARDGVLLDYLFDTMAATIETIEKDLGFRPSGPVRIEIFPDSQSFYHASTLTRRDIEVSGAVGIAKFNKIMMISPRNLVRGYRWLDSLSHEYIHLALVNLTSNNAPIWLQEGIAKYEEKRWRGEVDFLEPASESLLAQAMADGTLVTFQEMEPSLVRLPTPQRVALAYAQAATVIEFIMKVKNRGALRKLLATLKTADTYGAAAAVEALFGMPFRQFEEEWKNSLWQKKLKVHEGAELDRYVLLTESEGREEADLAEIRSAVARRRLRLGDGLNKRGHLKAAEIEYRRSLEEDSSSPLIRLRLGRLLARQGNSDEAIRILKKSLQLQPNFPSTYIALGQIYMARKELAKAEQAYVHSVSINPFDPEVHQILRQIYTQWGETRLAAREEKAYRQLTANP